MNNNVLENIVIIDTYPEDDMASRIEHSGDFEFKWSRSKAGYQIIGNYIERVGTEMEEVFPDRLNPSPHFIFGRLFDQIDSKPGPVDSIGRSLILVGGPEPEIRGSVVRKRGQDFEFWMKSFKNEKEAIQSFVSEFGLLLDETANRVTIKDFLDQQTAFEMFLRFSSFQKSAPKKISSFNQAVPPQFKIRLERESDGTVRRVAEPITFLAWMWNRVSMDMADNVEWSQCRYCGRPMALGGGHRNYQLGAEYCSQGCRVLYVRKQEAKKNRKKE